MATLNGSNLRLTRLDPSDGRSRTGDIPHFDPSEPDRILLGFVLADDGQLERMGRGFYKLVGE